MRGASRVLRVLRERARKGSSCVTIPVLAGLTRLTPSEVRAIVDELASRRLVVVSGDRVCYTGLLGPQQDVGLVLSRELRRALEKIRARRDIIYSLEVVAGSLPFIDLVIARRDGIVFLVKVVKREPSERLVAIARKVARIARRVAEGKEKLPLSHLPVRVVVPVLVADYGAPRLVEGVLFKPALGLVDLVFSPEPEISHPLVRIYRRQLSSSSS